MADIIQFQGLVENNEALQPLIDLLTQLADMPDEGITDDVIALIHQALSDALTPSVRAEAVKNMVESWEQNGVKRKQIIEDINNGKKTLNKALNDLATSEKKSKLFNGVITPIYDIIDTALNKYHNYSIDLPIKLDEGAKMPTYAHEGDAAADLSALETVIVPAHSISNKIKTGVHLQLPEGWIAKLAPRSSIGAKTPLRLSNELGIIDSGYTGDVTILFDNISDSDYTINAGDRIAQLWVEPLYRFNPIAISDLQETERNDNGFGSTGK